MKFSQRYGYTPVRDVVQHESMDGDLRVGLWNVFEIGVLRDWVEADHWAVVEDVDRFSSALWHSYFKLAVDDAPREAGTLARILKKSFFSCQWYEVYDLLEFSGRILPRETSEPLRRACNVVMERELAAYRFLGTQVVEITAPEEIEAIEGALDASRPFAGAHAHLAAALDMLADRDAHDYRNSIKESISAVEAMVNEIEGKRGTLGAALKTLGVDAHPALREAFTKLYGYTSDADGIRHALTEESDLGFEDAKFMLVSCSAFVNYLVAKAARTGVAEQGAA